MPVTPSLGRSTRLPRTLVSLSDVQGRVLTQERLVQAAWNLRDSTSPASREPRWACLAAQSQSWGSGLDSICPVWPLVTQGHQTGLGTGRDTRSASREPHWLLSGWESPPCIQGTLRAWPGMVPAHDLEGCAGRDPPLPRESPPSEQGNAHSVTAVELAWSPEY